MLNGVIFDMDGVIVDSHHIHIKAWREFLLSMGRFVTDSDLDFIYDGRKKEDILRYFLGDLTPDQIQLYGCQKESLFRKQAENVGTIPGVRRLLEELRRTGIAMAIGSSGSGGRVHYLLDHLKIRKYFASVVTAEDVAQGKPDPAIFCKAARELRVQPKDSLVIEDSVSGVLAAKAAGMKCLGIAKGAHTHALLRAGANNVLPNFMDASLSNIQTLFP